jgi:hypothetical protein
LGNGRGKKFADRKKLFAFSFSISAKNRKLVCYEMPATRGEMIGGNNNEVYLRCVGLRKRYKNKLRQKEKQFKANLRAREFSA